MEITIYNYHKGKKIDIPDETRGVHVEVITGDEIITCIGDGELLDTIDSAAVFGNPRMMEYPDGSYGVKVGTPEWENWMHRRDSYDFMYGDYLNDNTKKESGD